MNPIRITMLVENTAKGRNIQGEHGLSYWIDTGVSRILFDTGQTPEVLFHNAKRLNIDLATVDTIVLSHGHYDHTGGLTQLLEHCQHPKLVLHPGALDQRFSRHANGSVADVGIPCELTLPYLQNAAEMVFSETKTQIADNLWVTGSVPRVTDYEDTGGDFYLDKACTKIDPIVDDQSIFFDTPDGMVVLLGCAHAGVINTLQYIRQITAGRPIHTVIGGMHLLYASQERMTQTVTALRELNIQRLAPTHCTGAKAAAQLWAEFPNQWQACPVSTTFNFSILPRNF